MPGYEDFDEFIRQDFDAVVIAAPFHTHAYFAMREEMKNRPEPKAEYVL